MGPGDVESRPLSLFLLLRNLDSIEAVQKREDNEDVKLIESDRTIENLKQEKTQIVDPIRLDRPSKANKNQSAGQLHL
jgi:hypothetical protein